MPRYYRVKGKPGYLVYDAQLSMERPLGMRMLPPNERPKSWVARSELFEPVEMTARDSKTLREARDSGRLLVLAGPVVADHAQATAFKFEMAGPGKSPASQAKKPKAQVLSAKDSSS